MSNAYNEKNKSLLLQSIKNEANELINDFTFYSSVPKSLIEYVLIIQLL